MGAFLAGEKFPFVKNVGGGGNEAEGTVCGSGIPVDQD